MRSFVNAKILGYGRTLVNLDRVYALVDKGDGTTEIVFDNHKYKLLASGDITEVVGSLVRQQDNYDDIQHGKDLYRNSHPLRTTTKENQE